MKASSIVKLVSLTIELAFICFSIQSNWTEFNLEFSVVESLRLFVTLLVVGLILHHHQPFAVHCWT